MRPILRLLPAIVAAVWLVLPAGFGTPSPCAAASEIKIAVVMPEGSTWTNILHEFSAAVQRETEGEVSFIIYAGGVSGDEADVLRKMRVNRLHAGGFSGVGLGLVVPEIRIFEAPLLFRNYAEIDFVKERLFDDFAARFDKKGYVLLGFAEAGFVYLFSSQRIDNLTTLRKTRMWVWKGDRVAELFLDAFGIQGYPLQLADVNAGLETGMIDSYYSPPLASLAFQWYARIGYMLDFPVVNSTGALLMNKTAFSALSPDHQAIVSRLAKSYAQKLVEATRRDNAEALRVLREAGIEFLPPTPELTASFEKSAAENYRMSIPRLYSQQLFDQLRELIALHRAKTD